MRGDANLTAEDNLMLIIGTTSVIVILIAFHLTLVWLRAWKNSWKQTLPRVIVITLFTFVAWILSATVFTYTFIGTCCLNDETRLVSDYYLSWTLGIPLGSFLCDLFPNIGFLCVLAHLIAIPILLFLLALPIVFIRSLRG